MTWITNHSTSELTYFGPFDYRTNSLFRSPKQTFYKCNYFFRWFNRISIFSDFTSPRRLVFFPQTTFAWAFWFIHMFNFAPCVEVTKPLDPWAYSSVQDLNQSNLIVLFNFYSQELKSYCIWILVLRLFCLVFESMFPHTYTSLHKLA